MLDEVRAVRAEVKDLHQKLDAREAANRIYQKKASPCSRDDLKRNLVHGANTAVAAPVR